MPINTKAGSKAFSEPALVLLIGGMMLKRFT